MLILLASILDKFISLMIKKIMRNKKRRRNNLNEPDLGLDFIQEKKFKSSSKGLKTLETPTSGKTKKLTKKVLNSLVQNLDHENQQLNVLFPRPQNNPKGNKYCDQNFHDQTIDLLDDESEVGQNFKEASEADLGGNKNPDCVIDLCQNTSGKSEVIDLTESSIVTSPGHSRHQNLSTTVIEISEDESHLEQPLQEDVSDEIIVVGTFPKSPNPVAKEEPKLKNFPSFIPLSCEADKKFSLKKLRKKYLRSRLLQERVNKRHNRNVGVNMLPKRQLIGIGENVCVNSPISLPTSGLRPIIIDGSNVAFVHSETHFSCKKLEICINYFKKKGHKVTAFVPQFRACQNKSDNPKLLRKLEKQGDVILTPSKKVDGKNIVPYDDRFIVQTAVIKGGVIISRDNYNDLLMENPAWAETIKYRTLPFTWVDDVLMFPKDPLGEFGPTLEEFLRFH